MYYSLDDLNLILRFYEDYIHGILRKLQGTIDYVANGRELCVDNMGTLTRVYA